jgi:hypothetical protein
MTGQGCEDVTTSGSHTDVGQNGVYQNKLIKRKNKKRQERREKELTSMLKRKQQTQERDQKPVSFKIAYFIQKNFSLMQFNFPSTYRTVATHRPS